MFGQNASFVHSQFKKRSNICRQCQQTSMNFKRGLQSNLNFINPLPIAKNLHIVASINILAKKGKLWLQ